jgi:3-dehydroquinate dehydratase-2
MMIRRIKCNAATKYNDVIRWQEWETEFLAGSTNLRLQFLTAIFNCNFEPQKLQQTQNNPALDISVKSSNMPAKNILLLNGPNLNLLGTREPQIYGSETLSDIESRAVSQAISAGASLSFFQTNHEGALVDRIQAARTEGVDAIVINPAAFTHYSIALRDALLAVNIPFVEVHISNIHAREEWRNKSWLSDKAIAVICGLGTFGYKAAIEFCLEHLKDKVKL